MMNKAKRFAELVIMRVRRRQAKGVDIPLLPDDQLEDIAGITRDLPAAEYEALLAWIAAGKKGMPPLPDDDLADIFGDTSRN